MGEKGREERESVRKGERGKEEGRDAEEEECKQVKKDVTGWTVVTRNKRQRKMVQIFVKVDEAKVTPMEVDLTDGKVEDVMRQVQKDEDMYVTMHGRVLRRNEKLKSCGVTDGCTIQVTSRMRGGGKHKDKKGKVEKKQVTSQKAVSNEGPAILESEREVVIRMLEESEEYRKIVEDISGGSGIEVERKIQNWVTGVQERGESGQGKNEGDGMWTQMGGGSKEKRKARRASATAAGRARATAAGRARAKHRTGAKQARQAS